MVGKQGDKMLQYQVKHNKGSLESFARNNLARYSIIHFNKDFVVAKKKRILLFIYLGTENVKGLLLSFPSQCIVKY